jgi:hypothetical protein
MEDSHYGVCVFCGLDFGDHEHSCPLGLQPSYDSDPEPEKRMREEDRSIHPDLREQELWGP